MGVGEIAVTLLIGVAGVVVVLAVLGLVVPPLSPLLQIVILHAVVVPARAVRAILRGGARAEVRRVDEHGWHAGAGPGWFDDPWGAAELRWWDGEGWTARTLDPHRP